MTLALNREPVGLPEFLTGQKLTARTKKEFKNTVGREVVALQGDPAETIGDLFACLDAAGPARRPTLNPKAAPGLDHG
jgi:hypothetical protein